MIFENGEFDGQPYAARQAGLRFNHNAIIPAGHGRAGVDVRILNKTQEEPKMALVKVKLLNTGRYINVEEEDAKSVEEDQAKGAEESVGSGKKLEQLMAEVADLNAQIAELTAQAEEGKGELSVYKEKLDELLSDEATEAKAEGMNEESSEADEIIENAIADMEEEKKEEIKNSLLKPNGKRFHGERLKRIVLNVAGIKCDDWSAGEVNGAFRAQHTMIKNGLVRKEKVVAGEKVVKSLFENDNKTVRQELQNSVDRMWGVKKTA
jgi:hypothetical protein